MPPNRVFQIAAQTGVPTGGSASAAAIIDVPPTTLSATFRRLQRRTGSLARRSAVASTGSGIGMMALPPSAGPNAMSVIDRTRFGMTRPELFPVKAAVIPFPEGDGTPSGRTNAHANYSFSGLIAADPAHGIFKPQPATTTVTVSGASVPWRLDDATQFDTGSDPTALFIRQQTAINFKGAALAIQHYLHDTMMARAGTMVVLPAHPAGRRRCRRRPRAGTGRVESRACAGRARERRIDIGRALHRARARSRHPCGGVRTAVRSCGARGPAPRSELLAGHV